MEPSAGRGLLQTQRSSPSLVAWPPPCGAELRVIREECPSHSRLLVTVTRLATRFSTIATIEVAVLESLARVSRAVMRHRMPCGPISGP